MEKEARPGDALEGGSLKAVAGAHARLLAPRLPGQRSMDLS